MNPLLGLNQRGQFVWLDHISRSLIRGGELQRLIDQDGLGGVTSNPTIFEKAIAGSNDYDAALQRMLDAEPNIDDRTLAERLILEDIRSAADTLRPVYDRSTGANGFVSARSLATLCPRHRRDHHRSPASLAGCCSTQRDDQGAGHPRRCPGR